MNIETQNNPDRLFKKYYRPIQDIIQKPRNRIYTTTILSFLTISLFAWYAIRPTIQTILSLRKEIEDSIKVNEQMETKIINLVEAQAAYQKISKRLSILNEAIPETSDVVDLIMQIKEFTNSVELKILNISVETTGLTTQKDKKSNTQESNSQSNNINNVEIFTTPITMNLEGTYENVKEFILKLYSLRRIVEIVDVSLKQKSFNNTDIISMNIKIQAYSLRISK